jgi:hypothetical protein
VRLTAERLESLVIGRVVDRLDVDLCDTAVDRVVLAEQSVTVRAVRRVVGGGSVGGSVHGVRVGSSLRSSVVGAVRAVSGVALVRLSSVSVGTVDLVVLIAGSSNCVASVGSVVRRADVSGVAGGKGASCNRSDDSLLGIPVGLLGLAVPEVALGRAFGVVVGWARAKTLLLLVLADKEDLEESSNEEQESGDNGHGEHSLVHAASIARGDGVRQVLALVKAEVAKALRVGIGVANTKGSVHNAGAGVGTSAGQDGDSDEATNAQDVNENRSEGEEGDAAEAAGEDHSSDGVEHSNARNALNSLLPGGNALVAIGAYCEEVGVDA